MKKIIIGLLILLALGVAYKVMGAVLPVGSSAYLYQWYSADPSRVQVDPNTGKITRIWIGSVKVCHQLKTDLNHEICDTLN